MKTSDVKHLIVESVKAVRSATSYNPTHPRDFREILSDDDSFEIYVESLSEHMDRQTKKEFTTLANNTRRVLLESSMFNINPYETFTLPILSVFYPRLLAKNLVTVTPIDAPEVVKAFLKPYFVKYGDPNKYVAPSYNDISSGPGVDMLAGASINVPGSFDVLNFLGLTHNQAHLQKDFMIYRVEDAAANTADVQIVPTVDGTFSATVTVGGADDVINGSIDYYNGIVNVSSTNGVVTKVYYTVTASLEENVINPKLKLEVDKIRIVVKDRPISAEWSIQMQQDLKALFDIDIQAQLVTIIGQQIALDVDREIINHLLMSVQNLTPATHKDSFPKTPPPTFTWGQKMWFENVLPKISTLSAVIYNDTNIAEGNTIAMNPLDAAILESLNNFSYVGTGSEGGDLGYRTAVISGGRWKVLTSSLIPQGKALIIYKPDAEIKVVYYYCPYVPAVLTPFPIGPKPSLTILSRYGSALIRPLGISLLNITA